MKILETKRLELQEIALGDAPFLFQLLNTPTWLQFIGDRGIKTMKDAENYAQNNMIASYQKNGFGLYLVKLKENKVSIGLCGLIKRPTLENVDIGFALMPEYEGKGYAYEAAAATMEYAQNKLSLTKIVAITVRENERSLKLLHKLGLRFEKIVKWPDSGEELMLLSWEQERQ